MLLTPASPGRYHPPTQFSIQQTPVGTADGLGTDQQMGDPDGAELGLLGAQAAQQHRQYCDSGDWLGGR